MIKDERSTGTRPLISYRAQAEAWLSTVAIAEDTTTWPQAEVYELAKLFDECAQALDALDTWVGRMPDAGFTSQDPRWAWWHKRPRVI